MTTMTNDSTRRPTRRSSAHQGRDRGLRAALDADRAALEAGTWRSPAHLMSVTELIGHLYGGNALAVSNRSAEIANADAALARMMLNEAARRGIEITRGQSPSGPRTIN